MNNMDIKLGDGFHSLYNIPSAMAQNRSVIIQKEQQINVNSHGKFDQSLQSKQKQKQDIQQAEQENIYHNDNDNHNHHQHQHQHQHQRQIHNQNKNHQELFNGADQDHHQEEEEEEEEEEEDEEGAHGEAGREEAMAPLKKGPWTAEEDALLLSYVSKHGDGNWNTVQKYSGVSRNGKSCRLRWTNHLRPHLKKGAFSAEEERIIIEQHAAIGNRWSRIAAMLPGRTDNEIKNFWNTRKKRRLRAGLSLYPAGVKPTNSSSNTTTTTTTTNNGASTSSSCSDSPESMITSLRLGEDGSDINSSMKMIDHHQFSSICSSFSNNLIQAASHHPTSMAIIHTEQPVAFPSEISIVGQSSRRCADVSADVKKTQMSMSSTEPSLNVHGLKRGREATGFHQPLGNSMNFRYFSAHQSAAAAAAALARAQSVTTFHQIRNLNSLRSMDPFRHTQAFPYEPEPPDPCSVIRSHGIFIPTEGQHPIFPSDLSESHNNPSAEARSKNPFMSISNHRDDDEQKHLHGLKMELPSVQLTESADSSSGLSSPFTTPPPPPPPPTACHNMLPLSEVDSFGSTRNHTNETISSTSDGSSLLDAVLIQSVPLNLDQFLTSNKSMADHQPSAVSPCSRNASPMVSSSSSSSSSSRNVSPMPDAVPPSYHQSSNNIPLVESDPLSFLGGRSLTLLNDDHHHIKMSPTSSEAHSSSYVCQASGFLATGENNSDQKLSEVTSLLLRKMEGEEEEEDDLLTLLAFERPHSLPASDLCSIVTSVDHQAEETTYNEGGLEAMFSQPSSSLDSDFINAMSGINNMWELGSCVWNNMPGAL